MPSHRLNHCQYRVNWVESKQLRVKLKPKSKVFLKMHIMHFEQAPSSALWLCKCICVREVQHRVFATLLGVWGPTDTDKTPALVQIMCWLMPQSHHIRAPRTGCSRAVHLAFDEVSGRWADRRSAPAADFPNGGICIKIKMIFQSNTLCLNSNIISKQDPDLLLDQHWITLYNSCDQGPPLLTWFNFKPSMDK